MQEEFAWLKSPMNAKGGSTTPVLSHQLAQVGGTRGRGKGDGLEAASSQTPKT